MSLALVFTIVFLTGATILALYLVDNIKRKYINNSMSFREAMDLTELPVITFYNGSKKLNFLLDTGSNISQINSSVLPELNYKEVNEKNTEVSGIEGKKREAGFCKMTITYKGKEFVDEFCIHDLDAAFAVVKESSGVQIHGILGSLFFRKYQYVLDFDSLIAHSKK